MNTFAFMNIPEKSSAAESILTQLLSPQGLCPCVKKPSDAVDFLALFECQHHPEASGYKVNALKCS